MNLPDERNWQRNPCLQNFDAVCIRVCIVQFYDWHYRFRLQFSVMKCRVKPCFEISLTSSITSPRIWFVRDEFGWIWMRHRNTPTVTWMVNGRPYILILYDTIRHLQTFTLYGLNIIAINYRKRHGTVWKINSNQSVEVWSLSRCKRFSCILFVRVYGTKTRAEQYAASDVQNNTKAHEIAMIDIIEFAVGNLIKP